MTKQNEDTAVSVALYTVGMATVAAIIVGLGAWLLTEFVIGSARSDAITVGAWAAIIILFIGAVFGGVRGYQTKNDADLTQRSQISGT